MNINIVKLLAAVYDYNEKHKADEVTDFITFDISCITGEHHICLYHHFGEDITYTKNTNGEFIKKLSSPFCESFGYSYKLTDEWLLEMVAKIHALEVE